MKNKLKENRGVIGIITATVCRQDDPELRRINAELYQAYKDGLINRGELERQYHKGEVVREEVKRNIIASVGLAVDAQIKVGDYGGSGEINYMALGTSATAVNIADTELGTEVYRNETASGTSAGAVAILTAFFTESEVDGTFEEFGNFIDGTGSADSGILWSHVNVNWTKSDAESLTIQCRYEFLNYTA